MTDTPTLRDKFPKGHRRGPGAIKRLTDAYQKLFAGNGSQEDADLVLTDLAKFTGFFQVSPANATPDELRHAEGQRSVYARIHGKLRQGPSEREWLEKAVRDEVFTDIEEGRTIV